MENFGYKMIGRMLIGLGEAMQDENSDLRKQFQLSREQLITLIGIIKVAASPDIQRKYIGDLAERWGVTERTVQNWIELGIVRKGRKRAGDTRRWWYADEVDSDERELIRLGYFKPKKSHRLKYFVNMIKGFM